MNQYYLHTISVRKVMVTKNYKQVTVAESMYGVKLTTEQINVWSQAYYNMNRSNGIPRQLLSVPLNRY